MINRVGGDAIVAVEARESKLRVVTSTYPSAVPERSHNH